MLKSIHYLTASFYTGRGELDLSKTSRQEMQLKGKEECYNHQNGPGGSIPEARTPHRPTKLRGVQRKHRQDMYQVMDGSALMVLGKFTFCSLLGFIDSYMRHI